MTVTPRPICIPSACCSTNSLLTRYLSKTRKRRCLHKASPYNCPIEGTLTVFEPTTLRLKNRAYIAPELKDVSNYDCDSAADIYSFGVLLYELLVDKEFVEQHAEG